MPTNPLRSAPPVYRPQMAAGGVQRMAAPPVYRPTAPAAILRKNAAAVYRPQAIGGAVQRSAAPPVYKPMPIQIAAPPSLLQMNAARAGVLQRATATVARPKSGPVVATTPVRAPAPQYLLPPMDPRLRDFSSLEAIVRESSTPAPAPAPVVRVTPALAPVRRPAPVAMDSDPVVNEVLSSQIRQAEAVSAALARPLRGAPVVTEADLAQLGIAVDDDEAEFAALEAELERELAQEAHDDDAAIAQLEREIAEEAAADDRLIAELEASLAGVPETAQDRAERARFEREMAAEQAETDRVIALAQQAILDTQAQRARLEAEAERAREAIRQSRSPLNTRAARNQTQGRVATVAGTAASATRTALSQTAHIATAVGTHAANVLGATPAAAVAAPLALINMGRSARQAHRARLRAQAAATHILRPDQVRTASAQDIALSEIATYAHAKVRRRAIRSGVNAGLDTAAVVGGALVVAGGGVTPVAMAGAATAAVAGTARGGISATFAIKGIWKKIRGTKGKNRRAQAERLYTLAVRDRHPGAIQFLRELGVLGSGPTGSGQYTMETMAHSHQREGAIAYIMQKFKS